MERGAERLPFSILHTNMAEYDISLDGLNTDPNLRIPENQNPTQNTYFKLDFLRLPNTTYFCQGINLPSVTVGDIKQMTRFGTAIAHPGTSVNYDDLRVTFLVDEDFANYEEIHDWMKKLTPFTDYTDVEPNYSKLFSDATLTILNSAKVPKLIFTFKGCFPKTLDSIEYSSTITESEPIPISASFGFTTFTIKRV
jgi:hypothetical protein